MNLLDQGGILLKLRFGEFLRCSRVLNLQSNLSSHIFVLRACLPLNCSEVSYFHTAIAILILQTSYELYQKILPTKCSVLPVAKRRIKEADLILEVKFHQDEIICSYVPSIQELLLLFRLVTERAEV